MAPLISHVYELGFMEAIAIPQIECFQGISYCSGCIIELRSTCGMLFVCMECLGLKQVKTG